MGIIKTIIINDENINKQFAKKEVKKQSNNIPISIGLQASRWPPKRVEYLSNGIKEGNKYQTLLGVTGYGRTFTM